MAKRKNRPPQKKESPNSPPARKTTQKIVAATKIERHEGPIPPPGYLQEYEDIAPGFADRIISMAESETSHRHKIENKVVDTDIEFGRREFAER